MNLNLLHGLWVLIQSVWIETHKSWAKFRICQIQLLKKLATYDKLEELELGKKKKFETPQILFLGEVFIAFAVAIVVA